ncbi:MAG: S49 family peptidase, partial [Phycisphaerales bacterium]
MPDRQRDHLILQTLVSTAWAMEPHVLQSMSDIVLRHAEGVRLSDGEIREAIGDERYSAFTLGALGARGASGRTDGELPYQREGAIAVIDISGVIAKRASMVNGTSQPRGTSIDGMRAAYRAARRDDRVKGVLFRGDSPGGSVDGVDEMAAEIRAGRDAGFPTWGFGDGLAASACYYMLAQCDRIYGTSDLRAPSIGVYTVVVDSSKAAADRGYRVHLVRAGNLKGVGTPGVAISADEIASIQARIDTYRGMFKAAVMAGRRADEAKVEGWADGNVLIGAQNVASGVIDGIATFEAVLEEMNRKFGGSGSAGGGFPPRAAAAALPAAPGGVAGALPAADGTGVVQDGPAAGEPAATVRSDEMNRTSILAAMAGTMAALGHLVPDGPDGPGVGGGGAPNGSAAPGGTVAPPVQPQRQPAAPSGGGGESVDAAKLAADAATRAIADERARVNGIREAAKAYLHIPAVAKLEGEAVAGTMGLDLFRAKLLTTLEGAMAPMGGGVGDISITGDGWAREKEAQGVMLVQKMSGQVHGLLMAGGPRADHVARAMGYE